MGQGLFTKVAQVVAHELGVPLATRARDGVRHEQGAQHLADRRLVRQRPERHGGARRGAHAARAAGGVRGAQVRLRSADRRLRRAASSRQARKTLPFAELARRPTWRACQLSATGFYTTPKIHYDRKTLSGRPFYLLRVRRRRVRGGDRHADRRAPAARASTSCTTSARSLNPAHRPRPDRGRLHPGLGLAHHGGAVVERQGRAQHACARRRTRSRPRTTCPSTSASTFFDAPQPRGHDPPLQGRGRAAVHARAVGVPGAARRARERGRLSASRRASTRRPRTSASSPPSTNCALARARHG